jgi:hypothetical protein
MHALELSTASAASRALWLRTVCILQLDLPLQCIAVVPLDLPCGSRGWTCLCSTLACVRATVLVLPSFQWLGIMMCCMHPAQQSAVQDCSLIYKG